MRYLGCTEKLADGAGWVRIEAESKEKHGIWDPMPELTFDNLTLCSLQSRLQHIYHGQPYARVDFIPQSGTLDLASVP